MVARKDEPECMKASTCPHERLVAWLRGDHEPKQQCVSLLQKCVAEAVGTGMIVLFGCGVVCAVTLTGAQQGLWQVCVVWGFGVALAIYSTGRPISCNYTNMKTVWCARIGLGQTLLR